jgi:hypothetical protein
MDWKKSTKEMLTQIGDSFDDFGKSNIFVLRKYKSGEDVMVVVSEPYKFGTLYITEIWAVATFLKKASKLVHRKAIYLLQ